MSLLFFAGSALGGSEQLQQVRREAARGLLTPPGPLLLVLPPKPGPGHRGSSPETLPPAPKLDSCSFLTETAHVFMGLFYVKSWRISGETHACKKGKKKPLRWQCRFGEQGGDAVLQD